MNAKPNAAESLDLEVAVRVAADVKTVWKCFTDPTRFAAWLGAFAGGPPLPGTRIDPRVGGAVRVEYPGGQFAVGSITAFEPMKRVEMTWGYEAGTYGLAPESTRVEITLAPIATGTLVTLRHRGVPQGEVRAAHANGWRHYLTMIAVQSAADQHNSALHVVIDAYFQAWGEADPGARATLLDRCVTPDVRVLTAFASVESRAELDAHIANAQKHMPGVRLSLDGPPQMMQGIALFAWRANMPDGSVMMRGGNVADLSLDSRFTRIVSFGQP